MGGADAMKGSLPTTQRSNTTEQLWRKEKSFVVRATRPGHRRQGCNLSPRPRVGARCKGFQHRTFLDNGPFASERVPASWFRSSPGPLVPREGEQVRVHKCYLECLALGLVRNSLKGSSLSWFCCEYYST